MRRDNLQPFGYEIQRRSVTAAEVIDILHADDLPEGAYLLGHALDGVIWGRVESGHLLTTTVRAGKPYQDEAFDSQTLLQARLFTPVMEVYFYKIDEEWQERTLRDVAREDGAFDELHILWGDRTEAVGLGNDFSMLTEGAQGMRHAVPFAISFKDSDNKRVCLRVRHYFDELDSGVNVVAVSRLVDIEVKNG